MTLKFDPNDNGNPPGTLADADDEGNVAVRVIVTVYVDFTDDVIQSAIVASGGLFSVAEVVRDEIESNLEAASYVRRVSIESTIRKEVPQ